jgi:hypothetical protein
MKRERIRWLARRYVDLCDKSVWYGTVEPGVGNHFLKPSELDISYTSQTPSHSSLCFVAFVFSP